MSTLSLSHLPTFAGHGVSKRLSQLATFAWVAPLMARVHAELVARAAISELKQMSDRQLDDIGVARKDIVRTVRGR